MFPLARVAVFIFYPARPGGECPLALMRGSVVGVPKLHIPDGYLSPSTSAVMGAVMLPLWSRAVHRWRRLPPAQVPVLAMTAVFSFLVMMFNVPLPNGTTAHAVGGTLLAILFGPWTALLALSMVLVVQALLFGDGGVLALGANAFNMAFVLPFVGYGVFRLLTRHAAPLARRSILAAGVGAYVGINAAALAAGIELGLQPLLFSAPDGTPLYAPFGLSVAVPAMVLGHLTVGGVVEGIVTALAYRWVVRLDVFRQQGGKTAR